MFCVRVVCSSAALVGHNTPFIEIAMNFLRPLHRKTRHLVIRGLELRIIRFFTRIASVLDTEPVGNRLTVQGWVRAKRKMKSLTFVDVSDGSTGNHLQVAIPKKLDFQPDVGASVKVTGTIQRFGDKGQIELLAENVKLLGPCNYEDGYPFVPRTSYSMEYVRQHLDFRPRTNIFSSILRVRSGAANAFRNYLNTEGFFEVNAPVLTSCDCEGAGEVFSVKPSNQLLIRQMVKSEQLEEESFLIPKLFKCFWPNAPGICRVLDMFSLLVQLFRAENSKSRLHLAEFYMLEIEQILNDSSNGLETILSTIEKMLRKVTLQILDTHSDELEIIKRVQKQQKAMDTNIVEYEVQPLNEENIRKIFLPDDPYTVMTYKDAIDILTDARGNFKKNPTHQGGLAKEHELFLVEKNNNTPIFVTEWPAHLKPFYMKGSRKTPTVSAVDLLVPIVGELCGGSVRENDVDLLEVKMKELGLNEKMSWYINMRRFGNIKTGGFGMGFERYLQCLLNISNIKDVIPFPRWPYNCYM